MSKVISRLGHIAIQAPNLEESVADAKNILGLREVERREGTVYLTCDEHHHALEFSAAGVAGLDHVGLQARSAEALERLHAALLREGVPLLSEKPEEPGLARAIRFPTPGGHIFEVFVPVAGAAPYDGRGERSGHLSADALFNGPGVRPRVLGHALLKTENVAEMTDFLIRLLDFKLSDTALGGDVTWLRCNPDHHAINLLRGPAGLHHFAWEVEGWTDLERMADHMLANDKRLFAGPGRHGPGHNLFMYHVAPAGYLVEHFADLQRIYNDEAHRPLDWSQDPYWVNQWGPLAPADFVERGIGLAAPPV
ncbi:MAG TPA: VOC family protein [Chloroflexota bacterium]|nr:VOC family protein [Chloroflexota bacterium]